MRHARTSACTAVVLASALALLVPGLAAAQAVSIQLTATDAFDPMNVFGGGPIGAFTSPGTVACPGTQPTGNPMQPCPPGSRMQFRDVGWYSRLLSSSPLLVGSFYNVGNNALDANGTGQVWGTFRIDLDAGGAWEGSWTAERSKVGSVWVISLRGVGHGQGGAVDGMQLRFTEVAAMPTFMPLFWLASLNAEVLAPPSR